MAFKYTFKMRPDSSPHLYLHQLKEMIKNDGYIHPLMKNTLTLMKKTRQPFVRLATVKEIVFIPEKFVHFERILEPTLSGYMKIDWAEEEKEAVTANPKKFFTEVLDMYKKFGYEITERENVDEVLINELLKLTESKQK
jgi:hypothetical protein